MLCIDVLCVGVCMVAIGIEGKGSSMLKGAQAILLDGRWSPDWRGGWIVTEWDRTGGGVTIRSCTVCMYDSCDDLKRSGWSVTVHVLLNCALAPGIRLPRRVTSSPDSESWRLIP